MDLKFARWYRTNEITKRNKCRVDELAKEEGFIFLRDIHSSLHICCLGNYEFDPVDTEVCEVVRDKCG
jgi:hypothetical protein